MHRYARRLAIGAIVLVTVLIVALAGNPAGKDYIAYWSAGRLLVAHQDLYLRETVYALERSVGFVGPEPAIMRNPPWALFLAWPLGFMTPVGGLILWIGAAVAVVVLALRVFKVAARDRIQGFCFAPVYASLAVGQSSPFLLLGFTLLVFCYQAQPWLAGASLLLMAIKPHLFLVFWPVLLLDCLYHRRYRVLAGASVAFTLACTFALLLDRHVFGQYVAMLGRAGLDDEFVPTPAKLLGLLLAPHHPRMQFIPAILATAWALGFYWKRRRQWSLRVHATPLLLLCLVTSPYTWMTDEIVLLPGMLMMLGSPARPRAMTALFMTFNASALVMLMAQVQLTSGAYLWTTIAWCGLYLYSRHGEREHKGLIAPGELADAQA